MNEIGMRFEDTLNMKNAHPEFSGLTMPIADKLPRKSREEIEAARKKLENHANRILAKEDRRLAKSEKKAQRFHNHRRELTDKPQQNVIDVFGISGVYFLYKDEKCIYVGESKCIMSRISSHFKSGKDFDKFAYDIVKGKSKRKRMEKRLIKKHRPLWNITHNRNNRV